MIFKLKTSKKTQEIFEEIGKSTALKPYTLVKHAIAWSLKAQGKSPRSTAIQMALNSIVKRLPANMTITSKS